MSSYFAFLRRTKKYEIPKPKTPAKSAYHTTLKFGIPRGGERMKYPPMRKVAMPTTINARIIGSAFLGLFAAMCRLHHSPSP